MDFKELEVGDVAPDFKMPSAKKDEFHLYDELAKGPILLNFYVGDFGINCTTYMMRMIELSDVFKDMGIRVFPINPDSLESHKAFIERLGSPYDHIFDRKQEVSKTYGAIVEDSPIVKGFTNREFFLIDKDRKIRYIWRAPIPKVLPDMDLMIDDIRKIADW